VFDFLALITNKYYWKLHSIIIKFILRVYGIRVGKNFYCEGVPKLKIRGKAENIIIGDNVNFLGNIDIRNRENGSIVIHNNVSFDNDVRLVAANDAILSIGEMTGVGPYTVINCGTGITIGKNTMISGMVYIQDADHKFDDINTPIREQGYTYGNITIGDNVWLASNVTILKGSQIGSGSVVAAKAVVMSGQYKDNSILAKIPAELIKIRE
jgi:acetyltransferase-like isoleucine patch superfamily enzyme